MSSRNRAIRGQRQIESAIATLISEAEKMVKEAELSHMTSYKDFALRDSKKYKEVANLLQVRLSNLISLKKQTETPKK